MKIGFIGLGKLGLPCALACEHYGGHEVFGYDISPAVVDSIHKRHFPYAEEQVGKLLSDTRITVCDSLPELMNSIEILFVAVQTPHDQDYEGITRKPGINKDFDYSHLKRAVAAAAAATKKPVTLAVISTVLPGTMRREVLPLLNDNIRFCYTPFFIAMGTTIRDFLNPEFVLVGCDRRETADRLGAFYRTLHQQPQVITSIESAELAKVSYNTFIGLKIVFANTLMEICQKTQADCDEVFDVLSLGSDRLLSPRYLRGGMGDGGACHPRDNIAMAYLAEKLDLSYDIFTAAINGREKQTEWLCDLIETEVRRTGYPVVLCGLTYKPETNLTIGSPAILLQNMLLERGIKPLVFDPILGVGDFVGRAIYFISTNHRVFRSIKWPLGSIVIDPFNKLGRKRQRVSESDGWSAKQVSYVKADQAS